MPSVSPTLNTLKKHQKLALDKNLHARTVDCSACPFSPLFFFTPFLFHPFRIGVSGIDDTEASIENQAEHLRKKTFREELEAILRKDAMGCEDWMLVRA